MQSLRPLVACASLFFALFLSTAQVVEARELGVEEKSRFLRTVEAISMEPAETRTEFARVALQQLALAHSLEAELAREEIAASKDSQKLIGWAAAVDRFANDLTQMARELEYSGSAISSESLTPVLQDVVSVAFSFTGRGLVAVTGIGRMIILSHPRYEQQRALEQSILKEFCARQSCDGFGVTSVAPAAEIPVTTAAVKPAWNFTEDGYVCSLEGIDLVFSPGGNLRQQRMNCAAVMQEIMYLHDEVAWQIRHSVDVAWDEVRLFATPINNQHRVQLNRAGDSILLDLPLLAINPALLGAATQWLRLRIELEQPNAQMRFNSQDLQIDTSK